MARRRRQEDTDIDQYLYPQFDTVGIPRTNIRRNISISGSGRLRGDIWIATVPHDAWDYEQKTIALVECKDRKANLDDKDWSDAKRQGGEKALKADLNAFFVTNTWNITRCYNAHNFDEIYVDGKILSQIPSIPVLQAIQTQVGNDNSHVAYRSFSGKLPNPNRFRASLWNLRQIFRSSGISKGGEDSIIKTTLDFCILKIISEQQSLQRTIPGTILLWDDWREGQIARDIRNTISDLTNLGEFVHLRA